MFRLGIGRADDSDGPALKHDYDTHDPDDLYEDVPYCTVCFNPYKYPKTLPCWHTFCAKCLQNTLHVYINDPENREGFIPCPTCAQMWTLPENGVDGFPSEVSTTRLEKLLQKHSLVDAHPNCAMCNTELKYHRRCFNCDMFLCHLCVHKHLQEGFIEEQTEHEIVDMIELDRVDILCHLHNERCHRLCISCAKALCDKCRKIGNHKSHKVGNLRLTLMKEREEIKGLLEKLQEKHSVVEERVGQLSALGAINEEAIVETEEDMLKHSKLIVSHIYNTPKRYKKMPPMKKVKDEEEEHLDTIKNYRTTIKRIFAERENTTFLCDNLASLCLYAENVVEVENPIEMLAAYQPLLKRLRKMISDPLNDISPLCKKIGFLQAEEQERIGEIIYTDVQLTSEITQKFLPKPEEEESNIPQLILNIDMSGERTQGEDEPNIPTGGCFLPNGNFVVADRGNYRLRLYDIRGNLIRYIGEGEIDPWDVSASFDGQQIVVTDWKDCCIKIYSPKGELLLKWGRFLYPSGICVNHHNHAAISDTGPHSVFVHHIEDGKTIHSFGSKNEERPTHSFRSPMYVDYNDENEIVVSDCWNHCIKMFDHRGDLLEQFGIKGSEDGQLNSPRGVCADQHSNIMVADARNHRVSVFRRDGRFLRHLLTNKQIHHPKGLAVSGTGYLMVTEGTPAVKIFMLYNDSKTPTYKLNSLN